MRVPSSDIEARVAALEAYVDIPTEHNGTTVSGRLESQHKLLLALRADYSGLRAEFNTFRAEFNAFRAETNRRLTTLEDMTGKVLHGMTEIKRLLGVRDGSS